MKYIVAFFLCGILYACGNELDLIEDGKDIPIIYGLLSPVDTAQYFRVEKAFADEEISAVELAQDPSQLYYDNLRVALIHEQSGQEIIFDQVDGADEGYPREEGAFASVPNTLYKKLSSEINLVEGDDYRLEVLRTGIDTPVEANTVLVKTPMINRPGSMGLFDFIPNGSYTIQWRGNESLSLYDVYLEIKIFERDQSIPGSSFEERTLRWKAVEGRTVEPKVANVEETIAGIEFYSFLSGALEKDPKWSRRFRDIDIVLLGGGKELQSYRSVGLANLGITSSQDIPVFTNLSEGRGIFSSVTRTIKEDVSLNGRSLDSLKTNALTRDLGFMN